MDANRIEKTPILLMGLAAFALGLSALAAMYADSVSPLERNRRAASGQLAMKHQPVPPIYWSAPRLAPIDRSTLPISALESMSATNGYDLLSIKPPSFDDLKSDDPLWLLTADDLVSVTRQVALGEQDSNESWNAKPAVLVIYLPATPKRTAARPVSVKKFAVAQPNASLPILTFAKVESDWKVLGWDSLATFNEMGKLWGATASRKMIPTSTEPLVADKPVAKLVVKTVSTSPSITTSLLLINPRNKAPLVAQVRPIEKAVVKPVANPVAKPSVTTLKPIVFAAELTITDYLTKGGSAGLFPVPLALGEQLDRLADHRETAGWAWSFAYRLRGLIRSSTNNVMDAERILAVLSAESAEAYQLANTLSNPKIAAELRRSHYAIERRIDSWHACLTKRTELIARQQATPIKGIELLEVQQLEKIRWAMAGNPLRDHPMIAVRLPKQQQPMRLAAKLESFEDQPTSYAARDIARKVAMLTENNTSSGDSNNEAIVNAVEENYRNANLRLAISKDLLTRLFEQPTASVSRVNDRIAGRPVRGRSTTRTKLEVSTIPDPSAWRLGVKASGVIESDTISFGGPARLRSVGKTNFVAAKEIKVGLNGINATPTRANAKRGLTKLVGVATKYDKVPLFGNYARSTAKKEYSKARMRVKAEIERKVESRIQTTMDQKAEPAIAKLENRYREAVLDRAALLGLEVDPIELRTTESRLIGRLRLANQQQLAAHTPRMRAPSDSVLSFQLHESTVNNAFEGLGLEGNRFTTEQLRERISERFSIDMDSVGTSPQRASITFNELEPARVSFDQGKVRLTLSLQEMSIRGTKQANFKVHMMYEPELIGKEAWLVQKGTAQIEGKMRTSSRVRLHAALGKVLGEERKVPLIRVPADAEPEFRERFEGLTTNQLVIEDGWLGVAVGPTRSKNVAVRVGTYVR